MTQSKRRIAKLRQRYAVANEQAASAGDVQLRQKNADLAAALAAAMERGVDYVASLTAAELKEQLDVDVDMEEVPPEDTKEAAGAKNGDEVGGAVEDKGKDRVGSPVHPVPASQGGLPKDTKGSRGSKSKTNKKHKGEKNKTKSVRIKTESSERSIFLDSDFEESPEESDSGKSTSGKSDSGESDSGDIDPEYGRPLYARGQSFGSDVESVAYCGSLNRIKYVNRYGPKRYAIYRLEDMSPSSVYETKAENGDTDVINVSNPENRYGDKKTPNNKYKYTKRHIKGIYGVAWEGNASEQDLELIDPKTDKDKWPTTYVLVDWDIDGKLTKAWETRQAIRARWGKKLADKSIFEAACEAQKRYEAKLGGLRSTSYSRSPSTGLISSVVAAERQKSLDADSARNQSTVKTRRRRSPSVETDMDDLEQAFKNFKITYCRMLGVDDFRDLSRYDKTECVLGWQEHEMRRLRR